MAASLELPGSVTLHYAAHSLARANPGLAAARKGAAHRRQEHCSVCLIANAFRWVEVPLSPRLLPLHCQKRNVPTESDPGFDCWNMSTYFFSFPAA